MKVLQTNPKPKTIKTKIEGTDLEQIGKAENKDEVSDSRTKISYQKYERHKGLRAKNSGETMQVFMACAKSWNKMHLGEWFTNNALVEQ